MRLSDLRQQQDVFFQSGATRSIAFRKKKLKALKKAIEKNEDEILEALFQDFQKPKWEGWVSEVGIVYKEIDHHLENLEEWARPGRVPTPLVLFPSKSRVHNVPIGRSFIIAPWNYPFQLVMAPLVSSLAAGNVMVVKPSELTPATAQIVEDILKSVFPDEHVRVVQGKGEEVVPEVISDYFPQHIFFTGSPQVGKIIARQAAEHLIPTILELGGKSPAILDGSKPTRTSVRRILLGKFLNAGQTCIAPDYLLVKADYLPVFLKVLKEELHRSYGEEPLKSPDLAGIIHRRAFDRLVSFLGDGKVAIGGAWDEQSLRIEPTILTDVSMDSRVMKEEIFGPILPIVTYEKEEEVYEIIQQNPDPLALYIYSSDRRFYKRIIETVPFGGGAVNHSMLHLVNTNLPFGGIRTSGNGAYHGKKGFESFSHQKSIVYSGTWLDLKVKNAPYTKRSLKILKALFKL